MAGNKLYEPSAASNVAGGISGMRSFMCGAQASMPAVRRDPAGLYSGGKRCEQDAREPPIEISALRLTISVVFLSLVRGNDLAGLAQSIS